MFVVLVTYKQPLDVVDAHLAAHVEFLKRQYGEGCFIASGRRVPRTGGVILARATSREALQDVLRQDPFLVNGVADYEVIEFTPTMTAPELACLQES